MILPQRHKGHSEEEGTETRSKRALPLCTASSLLFRVLCASVVNHL